MAIAAAREDELDKDSVSRAEILADPSTVALLLGIVYNYVVLVEDEDDADDDALSSKQTTDINSAEFSVGAIEAMLPVLLKPSEPLQTSVQSGIISSELSDMLFAYMKIPLISQEARESARNVASQIIIGSNNTKRPLLEAAYQMWVKQTER